MEIKHRFKSHCIIENIREESCKSGLKKLQGDILSSLCKTKMEIHSVAEGKREIKSKLCHSNVLVILDDVDHLDQLEALAGSPNWFGDGSRIIITTRDEHLLKKHKVDHVSHVRLLSHDEAIWLVNSRAYNEEKRIKDYEKLSLQMVSYADGLPLALKVLGSFLYDKDAKEWMSSTVIDGNRLLQSMLKGNAIKNQSMLFRVKGLEIPKQSTNRLYAGVKYWLPLPEN